MMSAETDTSRREANSLRLENTQLRSEIGRLSGFQPQGDQRVNGASHMENGYYASGPSRGKDGQGINKGTELPPIRGSFLSDDSMAGVQYSEAPTVNLGPHRPQPNPTTRGNAMMYQQPEGVHTYPSMNGQPPNGFHPQQARVNGIQQSEQARPKA